MYKWKTPLDITCGIRITISVIGSKWKPCIIDALRDKPKLTELRWMLLPVIDQFDQWGEDHREAFT